MLYNLGENNSIANQFLYELRDKNIQKDTLRFRRNMERLGEIMAYEISKKLAYKPVDFETPLAKHNTALLHHSPVLVTILRAGIPFYQGFSNVFDAAESGFIGAYRKEDETEVKINLEYLAAPRLDQKDVIVIDPMLATGKSFLKSLTTLLQQGEPSHLHIAAIVATHAGIQLIEDQIRIPFTIWTFAVDAKLNDHFYIVPGLGDAGDLAFGEKI